MPAQLPEHIVPGMQFSSDGQSFRAESQHSLDRGLWIVEYEDGRTGVFTEEWLLEHRTTTQPIEPEPVPAPSVSVDVVHDATLPTSVALSAQSPDTEIEPIVLPVPTPAQMDDLQLSAYALDMDNLHIQAYVEHRYAHMSGAMDFLHGLALALAMGGYHLEAIAADAARPTLVCPGCQGRYAGVLGQNHRCRQIQESSCAVCQAVVRESIGQPRSFPLICNECQAQGNVNCRKCGSVLRIRSGRHSVRVCQACTPRRQNDVWQSIERAIGNNIVTEIGSQRPYSVEIESFIDPRRIVIPRQTMGAMAWVETSDGSIHVDQGLVTWAQQNGHSAEIETREFRSPPLVGDAGLLKLFNDVAIIRRMGFRSNSSCGLHVHVDAGGLSDEDKIAIHRFGKWYEEEMFRLVAPSRRENNFCRLLSAQISTSDRYKWLNMTAVQKHGTVEYRIHHGCTIPLKVAEWAKLCVKFTEAGMKYGRARQRPSATLMDAIGASSFERAYWNSVTLALHGPARPAPTAQTAPTPAPSEEGI